jgi:hypothetical protein
MQTIRLSVSIIAKSVFQVHCVDPLSILHVSGKPAAEKALPIDLPMRPMPIAIVTRRTTRESHLKPQRRERIGRPDAR